jgi:hypothetical protein
MQYKVLLDENKFEQFVDFLPDLEANEVYYLSLFARHKYCPNVPNIKDNQLARFTSSKETLKEHVLRLECTFGGYKRDGIDIPQEALALYIAVNPRNIIKANKALLVDLATAFAEGRADFNPLTIARSAVHHATDRKVFVDFDYDNIDTNDYLPKIKAILPDDSYRILKTRGGFHLLVLVNKTPKSQWYPMLAKLEGCDVKGSNTLCPVAGCTQGGFTPYLMET